MAKMNPAIKKKWVAALRSGEYKQGQGALRSNDEFCCLGVLCNLHAQAHPKIAAAQKTPLGYMQAFHLPPPEVDAWAKLDVDAPVTIRGVTRSLYGHNDMGRTFAEIADAIEAQL